MSGPSISVYVNEICRSLPLGSDLATVKRRFKPDADVLVVNGYPADESHLLKDGDRVVLIKRGERPSSQELEALLTARHSPGVHTKLKNAAVGIAGLGGLGSSVAIALARTGVGTLVLADFDVVEPSNLNRQQYFLEHLGAIKTEALAGLLSRINPYVQVRSHQGTLDPGNIPQIFRECDVLVECFDRAEEKAMILETVAEKLPETFLIVASGLAGFGRSNAIRTFRIGERIFMVGDLVSAAKIGSGLMAPRVGIAAHHQANLVVALLMDPERASAEALEIPEDTNGAAES
jgi:sulfur carrier protein ThiS adenylyltransferase